MCAFYNPWKHQKIFGATTNLGLLFKISAGKCIYTANYMKKTYGKNQQISYDLLVSNMAYSEPYETMEDFANGLNY